MNVKQERLKAGMDALLEENARFRKALNWIATTSADRDAAVMARESLWESGLASNRNAKKETP